MMPSPWSVWCPPKGVLHTIARAEDRGSVEENQLAQFGKTAPGCSCSNPNEQAVAR